MHITPSPRPRYEIKLQIAVASRHLHDGPERILTQRRTSEVRLQDDAGRIDDAPKPRPQPVPQGLLGEKRQMRAGA